MKRKILIWIGIIIVVGLAGAGYAYYQNTKLADAQNKQEASAAETRNDAGVDSEPTPALAPTANTVDVPGEYKDYSSQLVASSKGTVLLFFHAPWCPQCRMIESDIKSQGVPNNVTVLKIDYDSNQELRKKYDVSLQTTFVKVDSDGNKLQKYVAYNEPNFTSVKEALLK